MATKPFIAARIPESLSLKLDEHSKATGESKTQALINALAAYLGVSLADQDNEPATDRLSLLEQRVSDLERLIKRPQQISLFDSPVEVDTAVPSTQAITDNNSDNDVDNTVQFPQQEGGFTHREMAELTGMSYEAVRSKQKQGRTIRHDGKEYKAIKPEKIWEWQLV